MCVCECRAETVGQAGQLGQLGQLGRGIQLGRGKKESLSVGVGCCGECQELVEEDHLVVPQGRKSGGVESPREAVSVSVEEELSVKLSRDGLIETVDVKGTLSVRVNDAEASKVRIRLNEFSTSGFQCQLHPTISRSFLTDHVLTLKQADRGFPVDSCVSVLRWRQPAGGDGLLPVNVTCWPESLETGCEVNVEYTLNRSVMERVSNLRICIPLPSGVSPEVVSVEGNYHYVGARSVSET